LGRGNLCSGEGTCNKNVPLKKATVPIFENVLSFISTYFWKEWGVPGKLPQGGVGEAKRETTLWPWGYRIGIEVSFTETY